MAVYNPKIYKFIFKITLGNGKIKQKTVQDVDIYNAGRQIKALYPKAKKIRLLNP